MAKGDPTSPIGGLAWWNWFTKRFMRQDAGAAFCERPFYAVRTLTSNMTFNSTSLAAVNGGVGTITLPSAMEANSRLVFRLYGSLFGADASNLQVIRLVMVDSAGTTYSFGYFEPPGLQKHMTLCAAVLIPSAASVAGRTFTLQYLNGQAATQNTQCNVGADPFLWECQEVVQ